MSNAPVNPFIEYALRLQGDRIGDNPKPATLSIDIRKNEVILTTFTGGKNAEGRNDTIPAKMSAYTFGAMCSALEDAIAAEPGEFREGFRCYVPRKRQPGDTGRPRMLAATAVVGKDKQGLVFLSIVKKDPPHIKFVFNPGPMNEHLVGTEVANPAATSVRYAKGWLKIVERMVTNYLGVDVHDWRNDQNNGGNNNGNGSSNNYNRNNNNSGSGQQNNNGGNQNFDSFDDDLPM